MPAVSKKDLFNQASQALSKFLEGAKVDSKIVVGAVDLIGSFYAPKAGGGFVAVNIDEVTKRDKDGNFTEVKCNLSGAWLPATLEFFYEDLSGKSQIKTKEGVALKRLSRPAEATKKSFQRDLVAKKLQLQAHLINGTMDPNKVRDELKKLENEKVDFSGVTKDYFVNKAKEAAAKEATAKEVAKKEASDRLGVKVAEPKAETKNAAKPTKL